MPEDIMMQEPKGTEDQIAKRKGKVFVVGGGPGDFLLTTLKAIRLIKKADIVVYDHLVPEILIDLFFRGEKRIYAGKLPGKHALTQDEINELLTRYAAEGKTVVRLKGGDPFVFGRGGEECVHLSKNNVDFEVVPGVSSFHSVPAYAGIPLTHRGLTSSFTVATGSESKRETSTLDFEALARSGTIVFLMAVRNLPKVTRELRKHLDEGTPCALIQKGTTAGQVVVTGNLKNIETIARKKNIVPPAVLVVGSVVELRRDLMWFEKKPLFGKKIVITRPLERSFDLAVAISEQGGEPVLFPSIEIKVEPKHRENILKFCEATKDLKERDGNAIVFTSQTGVDIFLREVMSAGMDSRALFGFKIAAIGEKTAQALRRYGIIPDIVPSDFSTSSLLNELEKHELKELFFVRPEGIKNIEEELEKMGRVVRRIEAYKISKIKHQSSKIRALRESHPQVLTFTSPLSFESFAEMFPPEWIRIRTLACIGEVTARKVEKIIGKTPEIIPKRSTVESLVENIVEYFLRSKR